VIFPGVFKILAIFRLFTFLFNFKAVFKVDRMHSCNKFFESGIFPYNYLKILKASRKSRRQQVQVLPFLG